MSHSYTRIISHRKCQQQQPKYNESACYTLPNTKQWLPVFKINSIDNFSTSSLSKISLWTWHCAFRFSSKCHCSRKVCRKQNFQVLKSNVNFVVPPAGTGRESGGTWNSAFRLYPHFCSLCPAGGTTKFTFDSSTPSPVASPMVAAVILILAISLISFQTCTLYK